MTATQPSLFPEVDLPPVRSAVEPVESFHQERGRLVRVVRTRRGDQRHSTVSLSKRLEGNDLASAFDASWLRLSAKPTSEGSISTVRVADLFSGCGGMSVGIDEAARALQLSVEHVLCADIDVEALATYERNFSPVHKIDSPIENHVDSALGARLSRKERDLKRALGRLDVVMGGPPCQGHSDLNNHTRREDPKNALFDRMARFAEVMEPAHVIIENVPGVRHDKAGVFDRTIEAMIRLGYSVDAGKVSALDVGVPQRRHRTVVVASRSPHVSAGFLLHTVAAHLQKPRTVQWACEDLVDLEVRRPFDETTMPTAVSKSRIDWLFDNDEYDLPDALRPDCHRTKAHTYKSVYGRLWWQKPAWTITTGFTVMGQGRFLHPIRRRSITPHEAARLQFFPDFFDFGVSNRRGYAKQIGNAVPSKLAYVVALELLR